MPTTSLAAPAIETIRHAQKPLPKVRLAVPGEIEELLAIGRELYEENALQAGDNDMDEDAIRQAVEAAILHGNGILAVIGKDPIEALTLMQFHKYWYKKNFHLQELFVFCRAPYRRSRNTKVLLEFNKAAALKLGIPLLIGAVSNERTEQKLRLYQRVYGKPAGFYFLVGGHTGKGA